MSLSPSPKHQLSSKITTPKTLPLIFTLHPLLQQSPLPSTSFPPKTKEKGPCTFINNPHIHKVLKSVDLEGTLPQLFSCNALPVARQALQAREGNY